MLSRLANPARFMRLSSAVLRPLDPSARAAAAYARAGAIADEDVAINQGIARNGLALIEAIARGFPLAFFCWPFQSEAGYFSRSAGRVDAKPQGGEAFPY